MNDSSEILDIPEIAGLESGRELIRVPTEQNVPFTSRVRALVDTPEFQRLGEIAQLGVVARVYPGAKHTRLEHALGVYHNALRFLRQLAGQPRFCEVVDRRGAELLIVAALLHDVGHWPFCHPIEDMDLDEMPPHEANASRFLSGDGPLAQVLRDDWGLDPADVIDVLAARTQSPKMNLLRSIISGPIDVDKMDYLERDSLHCGVPYGHNFDKQRLIQSLVLNEADDGLAITSKGKTAAELMVFARYVMFSEVYWHHTVRAATAMFARAFYEMSSEVQSWDLFGFTDAELIASVRSFAQGKDVESLVEGVFGRGRRIHKRAAEFSELESPEIYRRFAQRSFRFLVDVGNQLAKRIAARTSHPVRPADVIIDAPPPHREVEFAVDVFFPKESVYRPLRRVSPVVDALARTQFDDYVKRVRVFVDPALREAVSDTTVWREELTSVLDELEADG